MILPTKKEIAEELRKNFGKGSVLLAQLAEYYINGELVEPVYERIAALEKEIEALKLAAEQALSDLNWLEWQNPKTNFKSSIILLRRALKARNVSISTHTTTSTCKDFKKRGSNEFTKQKRA